MLAGPTEPASFEGFVGLISEAPSGKRIVIFPGPVDTGPFSCAFITANSFPVAAFSRRTDNSAFVSKFSAMPGRPVAYCLASARLNGTREDNGGVVETIKGADVNVPDAVFAWMLDGKGGVIPLEDASDVSKENPCWLHLNYTHPHSAEWLATTPLLPNSVRDALAGDSLRPRVTRVGEGTLITLRCINGSTDERPDQLVAMRLYMDERLIVSTRQRKVLALDDVVKDLEEGTGPTDCGGWLVDVCDALTDHASDFIEVLHDKIIDLEDNLLDQNVPPRGALALLRKQLIVMRRYMSPQRDVYARLSSERLQWMDDDQRRRMKDIAERLGRGLDEIDSCIARTGVMADEIAQVMQESLARRTYTMSLMAMVFLPSTFLTGLFGVNLGGIPGGGWQFGFSLFCIGLVVLIGGVTWWLHRSKWL